MSDRSQGEGWWIASDGRWYPPQGRGWWLASDGNWYPPEADGKLSDVSERSARAVSVTRSASAAAVAAFFLGLSVGLLGGDDDPPAAVGVAAVVLMAASLGIGCMSLIVAVRGLRQQPDGARARGFAPGLLGAILIVLMDVMLWSAFSQEGIPASVHVALGLDVLIGAVAGLVWPLRSRPHPARS